MYVSDIYLEIWLIFMATWTLEVLEPYKVGP